MSKDRFRQELPIIPSGSQPENPCFSCGACCKGSFFPVISHEEILAMTQGFLHVTELIPNPKNQNDSKDRLDALAEIHEEGKKGYRLPREIVFTSLPYQGYFSLSQIGPCPQLNQKKQCEIYPDRPQLCANLPLGGDECNRRRKKERLPAIRPDGTVIPPETFRQRATRKIKAISASIRW
jgi:Fe-S-cluster containining protein